MGLWRISNPALWIMGFSQKEGINYDERFSPVARYISIRLVISIATEMRWKIY
jgi:hypothetical protein